MNLYTIIFFNILILFINTFILFNNINLKEFIIFKFNNYNHTCYSNFENLILNQIDNINKCITTKKIQAAIIIDNYNTEFVQIPIFNNNNSTLLFVGLIFILGCIIGCFSIYHGNILYNDFYNIPIKSNALNLITTFENIDILTEKLGHLDKEKLELFSQIIELLSQK